jgi:ribosomal protein L14E/L6E/L27E
MGVLDERKSHIVEHVDGVEERGVLVDHSELVPHSIDLAFAHLSDIFSVDENAAAGRSVQRDHKTQERRFPRTGATDNARCLVAPAGHIDSFENPLIAEALLDVFENKDVAFSRRVGGRIRGGRVAMIQRHESRTTLDVAGQPEKRELAFGMAFGARDAGIEVPAIQMATVDESVASM